MKTYTCRTCDATKDADQFGRASCNVRNDQKNYHCFECARAKKRANSQRRFDSMSVEQLEVQEEKDREYRQTYRKKHPEKMRAMKRRETMLKNIPLWKAILATLVPLLKEYEEATRSHFDKTGRWPLGLPYERNSELTERWEAQMKELTWVQTQLNIAGKPYHERDTVVFRIEFCKAKLAAVTADDMKIAERRAANPQEEHSVLPQSQQKLATQLTEESDKERAEKRAAMTVPERAADRAWFAAFWFVMNFKYDEWESANVSDMFSRAEKKLAEFRRGGCSWGQVSAAEDDAECADIELHREDKQLHHYHYSRMYPRYLAEEERWAAMTKKAKGLNLLSD